MVDWQGGRLQQCKSGKISRRIAVHKDKQIQTQEEEARSRQGQIQTPKYQIYNPPKKQKSTHPSSRPRHGKSLGWSGGGRSKPWSLDRNYKSLPNICWAGNMRKSNESLRVISFSTKEQVEALIASKIANSIENPVRPVGRVHIIPRQCWMENGKFVAYDVTRQLSIMR